MDLDKIKDTVTWKRLSNNPKFIEEFTRVIRQCLYHVNFDEISVEITDKKINISYCSKTKNRDLDSQYKLFNNVDFFLDDDNNLIINEASGRLESNYGYDFSNTIGGKLNTNYSCNVFDENGIELSFQSYGDKYYLNAEQFKDYNEDLKTKIISTYNPNLFVATSKESIYAIPGIVGNYSRFFKQIRSKDNLGIVKVSEYTFNGNSVKDEKEEYYFNTFFGNTIKSPELIHVMNGFPFAVIDKNERLSFADDYLKLGLTNTNYQDVARERFLKELISEKEKKGPKDKSITDKYDMMIEKMEKELQRHHKMI